MRRRAKPFTCFWLSYIVFGSSALEQFSENVVSFGLTFRWMTKDCHPSQGAGGGGGGGGEGGGTLAVVNDVIHINRGFQWYEF